MSKKKNTLKDLDEFLKQQAATLVSPPTLSEKVDDPVQQQPEKIHTPTVAQPSFEELSQQLKTLVTSDTSLKGKLYDLIINTLEATGHTTAEDKMLINTALYLKGGDRWKEVIREYWKSKVNR